MQSAHLSPTPAPLAPWFPRGITLLQNPELNKGTAFSEAERDALGLNGLLPPHVCSQEEQVDRVLGNLRRLDNPLEKYIFMASLHDRNEALFFRIVTEHPDEMMPIIYTPTVGLACQKFGHIFQRPRGVFVTANDRGKVRELLRNWPHRNVAMIVVTDGERILGLGDLGSSGMGIPVGKLSLYTACAGIHPSQCLPVMLDVGTNNQALRDDPLYLGLAQPRLTGAAYDELVDEFVTAACEAFPGVVVQFEDFANHNAFRLLKKYRDQICTFNDDIQGTAAVALSGLCSALRVTGGTLERQRLLFLGAGEAATGIADLVVAAMVSGGADPAQARRSCWLFDSSGLVVAGRRSELAEHKLPYAHEHAAQGDFVAAIRSLEPTALIGVAAQADAFTPGRLRRDGRAQSAPDRLRPVESDIEGGVHGRTGVRTEQREGPVRLRQPVRSGDDRRADLGPAPRQQLLHLSGVGLGTIAVRSRRVTDEMFLAAATALAAQVTVQDLEQGSLFPPLSQVREVSTHLAVAVAEVAFRQGHAGIERPADLLAHVRSCMYDPAYSRYV